MVLLIHWENKKSLVEDGEFALEVLTYIRDKINEFKKEDNILYALYSTPAESLCGLQVEQFRAKYGIIEGVSDRPYVSNSFHCAVWEDITPIQKQAVAMLENNNYENEEHKAHLEKIANGQMPYGYSLEMPKMEE